MMTILVNVKKLGKRKSSVETTPFNLENNPKTAKDLIIETVKTCVKEYNKRKENVDVLSYLTKEEIEDKTEAGKVGFGVNYGEKKADLEKAIDNALVSFEDGIYRIFKGKSEITKLDEKIEVKENDEFTFVRMTMLAGRMF